ncbi:hypothetical protein CC2G_004618 [Coprinopsis cinerea AmutBmut pab1-1]|nr:hypothetical protein CC2G_004618 [Coprinopsis cinerea AmutBmut pab1-1]
MSYDPIYYASVQPNNIDLHTIYRSLNGLLTLISVTPFWAVSLKLVRYTPQDAADICLLLRNGTMLSRVQWSFENLREWLFANCWVMGYANYDRVKLQQFNVRLQHALKMVNEWGMNGNSANSGSTPSSGSSSQPRTSHSSGTPSSSSQQQQQRSSNPSFPMPETAWSAVNVAFTPPHQLGSVTPLVAMGGGGEIVGGEHGRGWNTPTISPWVPPVARNSTAPNSTGHSPPGTSGLEPSHSSSALSSPWVKVDPSDFSLSARQAEAAAAAARHARSRSTYVGDSSGPNSVVNSGRNTPWGQGSPQFPSHRKGQSVSALGLENMRDLKQSLDGISRGTPAQLHVDGSAPPYPYYHAPVIPETNGSSKKKEREREKKEMKKKMKEGKEKARRESQKLKDLERKRARQSITVERTASLGLGSVPAIGSPSFPSYEEYQAMATRPRSRDPSRGRGELDNGGYDLISRALRDTTDRESTDEEEEESGSDDDEGGFVPPSAAWSARGSISMPEPFSTSTTPAPRSPSSSYPYPPPQAYAGSPPPSAPIYADRRSMSSIPPAPASAPANVGQAPPMPVPPVPPVPPIPQAHNSHLPPVPPVPTPLPPEEYYRGDESYRNSGDREGGRNVRDWMVEHEREEKEREEKKEREKKEKRKKKKKREEEEEEDGEVFVPPSIPELERDGWLVPPSSSSRSYYPDRVDREQARAYQSPPPLQPNQQQQQQQAAYAQYQDQFVQQRTQYQNMPSSTLMHQQQQQLMYHQQQWDQSARPPYYPGSQHHPGSYQR